MDGTLAKDPVEKAEPTNDRCKMALELGTQQHTMQHGKRKSREQRKQQPSHGAAQVQLEVREVVEPPRNELHLERQTTTRRHTREREREQESEWLGRSWTSIDRSLARLLDSRTQRDIANYRERPEACFALLWTLIWGTLVTPKRPF